MSDQTWPCRFEGGPLDGEEKELEFVGKHAYVRLGEPDRYDLVTREGDTLVYRFYEEAEVRGLIWELQGFYRTDRRYRGHGRARALLNTLIWGWR